MKITLQSSDSGQMHRIHSELQSTLKSSELDQQLALQPVSIHRLDTLQKGGETIELANIALVAVGAGGALTVALAKDGFLTQLAKVLEKYIEQKIKVTVTNKDGQHIHLSGSAGQIRKLLKQLNQ